MARLETTLESFSKNANATRSATADYTDELEQHVAELDQVQGTGQILSSLADLAKAMLERTRKLETDMRRSEEHTSELQSLMRISYAVFCLKKKIITNTNASKEKLLSREPCACASNLENF